MQGDKRKNAKGSYVPVQIQKRRMRNCRKRRRIRGTDREKISTNEKGADTKKQRLEDKNDRPKSRPQRKEEQIVREKAAQNENRTKKGDGGGARKKKQTNEKKCKRKNYHTKSSKYTVIQYQIGKEKQELQEG